MALPSPEEMAGMLPEELAPLVLQELTGHGQIKGARFHYSSYCSHLNQIYGPRVAHHVLEAAGRSLTEACAHLQQLGFVAFDTDVAYGWMFVTRRGNQAVASLETYEREQIRARFPAATFHRLLCGASYDAFVRGNFQQAVTEAFREIGRASCRERV